MWKNIPTESDRILMRQVLFLFDICLLMLFPPLTNAIIEGYTPALTIQSSLPQDKFMYCIAIKRFLLSFNLQRLYQVTLSPIASSLSKLTPFHQKKNCLSIAYCVFVLPFANQSCTGPIASEKCIQKIVKGTVR